MGTPIWLALDNLGAGVGVAIAAGIAISVALGAALNARKSDNDG